MKANLIRVSLAGFVFLALAMLTGDSTHAQCSTCATPTVAYQPVAVQPAAVVTTQYTGWYPGKWFDQRPPAKIWSHGTYVHTLHGSLRSLHRIVSNLHSGLCSVCHWLRSAGKNGCRTGPVVQTSYYSAVAASPCSSCVQTVARPVVLSPVVTTGCSTCGVLSCGGCSACSTCSFRSQPGFIYPTRLF